MKLVFRRDREPNRTEPNSERTQNSELRGCFKTPVSHGGARGEKSKERGGDEPRRGLSTTRDAGIRRLSPRPEGVAAARGRLRRQTSSTTRFEVVCVGLPCIRPLGAATVATRVLKQPLSSEFVLGSVHRRSRFGAMWLW